MNYYYITFCCGVCVIETMEDEFPLGGATYRVSEKVDHICQIKSWEKLSKRQHDEYIICIDKIKGNTPAKVTPLHTVKKPPDDPGPAS